MAKIDFIITFSSNEVNQKIPYALICQARYGSMWNTSKTQREYERKFTEEEREESETIFRQAHKWYITSGVPNQVSMPMKTFILWLKLVEFCVG